MVDSAIENGIYAIIDWHSHEAEQHQAEAISFFTRMAERYAEYPNVIYEIYNEPAAGCDRDAQPDVWSRSIKPYAEAVVAAIRAVDPDNLIIVGTACYSQNVDQAARDPIVGGGNLAYTFHFYGSDVYHQDSLRGLVTEARSHDGGIPIFVTEWGVSEATGDGEFNRDLVDVWVQFMKDNQLSHANWSIIDKPETSAALVGDGMVTTVNTQGNWSDSDLSDSGRYVRELIRNW